MKNIISRMNNISHQIIFIGAIMSILLGIILVVLGFYFKKKEKSWWIFLVLLGTVTIVSKVTQLL